MIIQARLRMAESGRSLRLRKLSIVQLHLPDLGEEVREILVF
jgi:hypothetical protein